MAPAPNCARIEGIAPYPPAGAPGAVYLPAGPQAPAVFVPGLDPYATQPPPSGGEFFRGIGIFGEVLYLNVRDAEVPFAVPQDGIGLPGTTPMGPVSSVEPDFELAFRVGVTWALGIDSHFGAAYSWYEADETATAEAAGANVINPLAMFPGTFNAGFTAQEATANQAIEFQLADLDYHAIAHKCERYWYGYFAGVRYATLDQQFDVTYPFALPDGTTTVTTNVDFNGIGLRLGLEGERQFTPNYKLVVYGIGTVNLLAGEFDASYVQVNQFGGTEVSTAPVRTDRADSRPGARDRLVQPRRASAALRRIRRLRLVQHPDDGRVDPLGAAHEFAPPAIISPSTG